MVLNRIALINKISVFLILYASTSFYCKNYYSETENTIIFLSALLLLFIAYKGRIQRKIVSNGIMIIKFLFIIVIGLVSSVLNRDEPKLILYEIIVYILALLFISVMKIEEFKIAFIDIMVFVSGFTIITYFMYLIFPNLFVLFPVLPSSGQVVYNLGFSIIRRGAGIFRAYGFFWEPGAFQTFINFAIPLLVYDPYQNSKKLKLFILFIALLLTFSTTGYIVGVVNLLIVFTKDKNYETNKFFKLVFTIIIIILFIYLIYPIIPESISGVSFGFSKIRRFLQGTSIDAYDSSSVRFDSIYYPLQLFFSKPIFGTGFSGLDDLGSVMLHTMVTCTPVNYFAVHGFFYGIIIITAWYTFCRTIVSSSISRSLIFLVYILAMFSEQYMNYLIMNLFILYGLLNQANCNFLKAK